jgi:hypothetical protein
MDMHVHTCLSPCGELDMHPAAVACAAAGAGLHGFVVCDHNAADNVPAVMRAARAAGCVAVPGMEITSEEEVHVVALLPDAAAAGVLHARVAAALPGTAAPAVFGDQVIANEAAEVLGFNTSQLAGATTWSLERTVREIHRSGGAAVPAHVDRERFGLFGQLGFLPTGLPVDALEVSARMPYDAARTRFGAPHRLPVVTGSDAHTPSAIGRAVTFLRLEAVTGAEVAMALRAEGGRAVLGGGRPMEDLALHVIDIAQNSVEAGATWIAIDVTEALEDDELVIRVYDNGRGMDPDAAARAADPFYTTRTTRRVGLGLALLHHAAEVTGGRLEVRSSIGEGTEVVATFRHGHVDRAPLGDLETMVLVIAASRPDLDLEFTHRRGAREYGFAAADLRRALDGASLTGPEGLALLRDVIRRGEADLAGGPDVAGPAGVTPASAGNRRTRT